MISLSLLLKLAAMFRLSRSAPLRPLSRALSSTPRALSKTKPNPDAPVDEGPVDPAARGVNEMRRQWGGLIDNAEAQLEDERAATKAANRIRKAGQEEKRERGRVEVDLGKHEGLEAEVEPTVDPAARGVNEMRKQWGDLIDKK